MDHFCLVIKHLYSVVSLPPPLPLSKQPSAKVSAISQDKCPCLCFCLSSPNCLEAFDISNTISQFQPFVPDNCSMITCYFVRKTIPQDFHVKISVSLFSCLMTHPAMSGCLQMLCPMTMLQFFELPPRDRDQLSRSLVESAADSTNDLDKKSSPTESRLLS